MEEHENPKLYRIRHSLAHVLAQAVKIKYPDAQLGFGPPTDIGFFYDFDFGSKVFALEDLKEIEKIMKKIIGQRQPFERTEHDVESAVSTLATTGTESYKTENIRNLASRDVTKFSFYVNKSPNGKLFMDLCEGPHVEHTGELPPDCFKLDRVAGAYWLGDEKNKMLTRIYAVAFENKEKLDEYMKRRAAAEEFDHKKLGKELDLFHFEDIIGKGLPMWLPAGAAIRDSIESYAKEMEFKYGYQRVATPHITKGDLYVRSQHFPAYKESMFPPMIVEDEDGGKKEEFYLKPMNCPHHHLIYASRMRSYRDLPYRIAEYGTCYRYEQSGEVTGLLRVRCMTMNDAHIYIRPDQFEQEFAKLMQMYKEFYDTFGFTEYRIRLSLRGVGEKFQGDPEMWDKGEALLQKALEDSKMPFYAAEGEAAFYGPKVDFQFKNLMGREETLSTIQVDFLSPDNFKLSYIDDTGKEARPVIIHRAPLSTHERFLSFLIEYYGGAFPTWCSPVQVAIIPVADEFVHYCKELAEEMRKDYMRVEVDDSSNSFNKRIRNNTVRKIPIMLICGQNEVDQQTVTIRRYGFKEQQSLSRADFMAMVRDEIKGRKMLRQAMGSII